MITIPAGPVRDFVDATNRHDATALVEVFAADATVRDDGSAHTGHAEILAWLELHQIAPRITLLPTSYEDVDSSTARLVATADGDFAGGPLPFAFDFSIRDGAVSALRIDVVR